jgi:PAS domain S-box-containing protein
MLLLDAADSGYAARIEDAGNEAGLAVRRLDNLEATPSDAALIAVGPGIADPLNVARHLRRIGGQALLVFFTTSSSARNALKAELLRDPFLCARYELIEIPDNPRHLASRMGRVANHINRQLHAGPISRRRRRRSAGSAGQAAPNAPGSEPYLANIVAHASDAIFTTDEAARVTTWNGAAERLFGFAAEAAVGQTVDFLDPPEGSTRLLGAVTNRVFASGASEQARVTCATGNGGSIEVAASVAPVCDADGDALGLSVIARDDTEQRRLEEALRDAKHQKDEFLAIMSHELRTPLTSILGYTDMLLRGLSGPLAPLTNKYVGNVRTAGDRLLELVNGLLDYTRLEAGAERLEVRALNLMPLVKQSVEQFQANAAGREIDLRLEASSFVGRVLADGEKIDHVLRSFLGNALKFTPDGGRIEVCVDTDPDFHDTVRISVADSGVGLRDEQLTRVWERFYQGDASLTRPYGGMGLGLSIARHLVTLHGGRVGATSSGPGLGSTFWFTLPLARAS